MAQLSKPRSLGGCVCLRGSARGRVSSPTARGGARRRLLLDDTRSVSTCNSDRSDDASSGGSTRDSDGEQPSGEHSVPSPGGLAESDSEAGQVDDVMVRPARICRPERVCGLGFDFDITGLLPQWLGAQDVGVSAAPPPRSEIIAATAPQRQGTQIGTPSAGTLPPTTVCRSIANEAPLPKEWEPQIQQLMALRESGGPLAKLSDFAKAYGDEAFCTRLLRKYDGDVRKCTYQYSQALQWREQNEELLTTRKFRLAGDYRVIGADASQRPVLYMCMKNQLVSNAQGLDHSLVVLLQAIDNMPPGVQKTIHIWDCHGMKMSLNMNPAPLARMAQAQEGYFAERMHELILVDMPRVATFLKDAVWGLLPEKTRRKIKFMTPEECRAYVQRGCEEATAVRVCSAIAENRDRSISLEQRKQSWLRVGTQGELLPMCE